MGKISDPWAIWCSSEDVDDFAGATSVLCGCLWCMLLVLLVLLSMSFVCHVVVVCR